MSEKFIKNSRTILSNPHAHQAKKQSVSIEPLSFGKVALLMGGSSGERAISLESGQAIFDAMKRQGIQVEAIDVKGDFLNTLIQGKFDRVFNIVHGKQGEDGVLQGLLEMLELPYVGSDVTASAFAMDKARSKLIWSTLGLPTAAFGVAHELSEAAQIVTELKTFPLAVKPNAEGSSLGVTKLMSMADLPKAFALARQYGPVIIEKWIEGDDFFVSIVGDDVYPAVQVKSASSFYDYHAKYQSEETLYLCPPPIEADEAKILARIAEEAYYSLGCRGWGRVDLVRDKAGQFWILEVNTLPGMTSHSLVPMSARAAGISFDELVVKILSTSLIYAEREKKQIYGAQV